MKENWFIKLMKWLGGAFEDQDGGFSRKAAIGYVAMLYLGKLVDGSLNGKEINEYVIFTIAGIILFSIGAITSEFFAKYSSPKNEKSK